MSSDLRELGSKQRAFLNALAHAGRQMTASELSRELGVTTRSIRNYVNQVRSALGNHLISSSENGYTLDTTDYDALLRERSGNVARQPADRVSEIISLLIAAPLGADLYDLASKLYVSESTIETDLRKVRRSVSAHDLSLARTGSRLQITGREHNKRKVLSDLIKESSHRGFLDLDTIESQFGLTGLSAFKSDVIEMLDTFGYFVNEYTINSVMLHILIAVSRSKNDTTVSEISAEEVPANEITSRLVAPLQHLVQRHYDVELAHNDLVLLASMLTTRVIAPKQQSHAVVSTNLKSLTSPETRSAVRAVLLEAHDQFLIDLDDPDLIDRLTLHYTGLLHRASNHTFNENPLTKSIKNSYPMVYEVAVFIASRLQAQDELAFTDDEIAYIAMHVGAYLERQSQREDRVSAAIAVPTYYDLPERLRQRIGDEFASELSIDVVITRTDVAWDMIDTDLIITTIEDLGHGNRFVVIPPFLDETGIARIREAINMVRSRRRRNRIKQELEKYSSPEWFQRNVTADSVPGLIAKLGEPLVASGVIDDSYIENTLERERISPTAFGNLVAIPHALTARSQRNALSIAINDQPFAWGDSQVSMAILVAFGKEDRAQFQKVFEQLVEVFSNAESVNSLVQNAHDFDALIETVARLA